MNEIFNQRAKQYFNKDSERFLNLLQEPCSQGFFLNTNKANKEGIFNLIDFKYEQSDLTDVSFYHHEENIGKTKAYELGLIYPQEIAASLTASVVDVYGIKTVVDMCAAPGGKTINILNKLPKDTLCISNDINYKRALVLSQNLERLGLDNVVITNKQINDLALILNDFADLVILDAPCSGEGMIRKYSEILDDYSIENINNLASIQSNLLEDAYKILKNGGQLLYSTCTYAFEEDENQIKNFLNKHEDIELVNLKNEYSSTLKGTIKLSPLNNTEGQFICLMRKKGRVESARIKVLKPIKEKLVDEYIKNNFNLEDYFLYKHNEHYYLSLIELPDLGNNIIKYGIYAGDIIKNRFEPNHNLYRANSLIGKYKYSYDLDEKQYEKYIEGYEINANLDNNYYLMAYHNHSLGFGKCVNKIIKNKYPKGLRK